MATDFAYDPVTAIDEAKPVEETAVLFPKIRQTMRIPLVTSIWRGLAGMDDSVDIQEICPMVMQAIPRRAVFIGFAASLLLAGAAPAAELNVVSSGGGLAALKALEGEFERQTGHKLVVDFAPSMGTTPGAVPQRLARGENLDSVLMGWLRTG
jgi:hypothetical protein